MKQSGNATGEDARKKYGATPITRKAKPLRVTNQLIAQLRPKRRLADEVIELGTITQLSAVDADNSVQRLNSGRGAAPAGDEVWADGEIFMDKEAGKWLVDPTTGGKKRFADQKQTEQAGK